MFRGAALRTGEGEEGWADSLKSHIDNRSSCEPMHVKDGLEVVCLFRTTQANIEMFTPWFEALWADSKHVRPFSGIAL